MGRRKKSDVVVPIDSKLKTWYETNNIVYEKNQLYYDFFIMLFNIIENTYLGIDIINNEVVTHEHFKWCFNKTVDNFDEKNIKFKKEGPLYDYLWFFFHSSYYKHHDEKIINNIYVFFENLFNYERTKTNAELDTYIFLYRLFEFNLIK